MTRFPPPSMPPTLLGVLLLGGLFAVSAPAPLQGQDVELLGKIHGTRPPQAYYDMKDRDPGAFDFRRALFRRGLRMRDLPDLRAGAGTGAVAYEGAFARLAAAGSESEPVSGTFHFPLILGLFSDSPEPSPGFLRADVQAEFFDGPQSNASAVGTVPDYYHAVSGGRITLTGAAFDWQRTPLTQSQVAAGVSGLGAGSRVGEFIVRTLQALDDGSVDWGVFDNDGPDGLPNSGDDDGYVDVLAVVHPTPGGECRAPQWDRNNRVWSHRWNLESAAQPQSGWIWAPGMAEAIVLNQGYVTRSPSAAPGVPFIKILDYTIQPVRNCDGDGLNDIGVFAHELGHGFGLPDLYVTGGSGGHEGIGNWGLMGTGAWGCDGQTAWSPCHMSAWSKAFLGWADVETLPSGTDLGTLVLPPVETSGKVYRMDSGDGSGEYLLLENRQALGFDEHLYAPGLLVWQIDPATIQNRWNTGVNNDPDHMGVWLRQADGLNELAEADGGRGDGGDPFPGSTGNTLFHAGSNPGSWSHAGRAMGLTLMDIAEVGQDVSFRALTRYQTLTLTTQGSPSGSGLVSVDGQQAPSADWDLASAPFQERVMEAAPGEEMAAGTRVPFQGWADGGPRVREYVTGLEDAAFTARYGGLQYRVAVSLSSPASPIVPGHIEFSSGDTAGWIPAGGTTTLTAIPRTGFAFQAWSGALAGRPNPATITVDEPLQAGASFDVSFGVTTNPTHVQLQGTVDQTLALQVENANLPVVWDLLSGELPPPMVLTNQGVLFGAPLERGSFPLALRVTDAIGLQADLSLEVEVVDPPLSVQTLASPFLLSGSPLTSDQQVYLDRAGNDNGAYDLGDFRAFVLRNPSLPSSDRAGGVVEPILLPLGADSRLRPLAPGPREERP